MSTGKRPRGRPRGSGIDDSADLAKVADLLVYNPSLTPSSAMKRVMRGRQGRETPQTLLRRWQVKWKAEGNSLLAAARERVRPRPRPTTSMPSLGVIRAMAYASSPAAKAAMAYMNSPAAKAALAYANSPAAKAAVAYMNSPAAKAALAYANSPAAKAALAYINSPAIKAMQDY